MHALIVDDEVHSVRGLQAGVQWESLGIRDVYTAHSMKQAQEVFDSKQVDLMVCDIEMPNGSGMDLLKWVRERYPDTETIFLTCHSDFSYAKQAIQLSSFDYLLKPVQFEDLEQVIGKALDKIKKEREYYRYAKLWESHKPQLKERFWQDLFRQTLPSIPSKIAERLQETGLPIAATERFIPILIRVRRWHKPMTEREERIMEYALRNAAEEMIANNGSHAAVFQIENGSVVVVIPASADESLTIATDNCSSYIRQCISYFACDLCCYIGQPLELHEMTKTYQQQLRLDHNNVTLFNKVIPLEESRRTESAIPKPSVDRWGELMKQGDKGALSTEIGSYLTQLKGAKEGVDARLLHSLYQDMLQMIFFVLQTKGLQANQVFSHNILTEKPDTALRSLDAFHAWMNDIVDVAMNQIHSFQGNMPIVERVKRFIDDHTGEQSLTRDDIASHVYLNPDYLSRVFKKETGMSINDYVTQRRIERAKYMLQYSDMSISDIAVALGYSNLSYLSTLFKKETNMNPGDYRKQFQKK